MYVIEILHYKKSVYLVLRNTKPSQRSSLTNHRIYCLLLHSVPETPWYEVEDRGVQRGKCSLKKALASLATKMLILCQN